MDSGMQTAPDDESPETTTIVIDNRPADVIRVQRNVAVNPDDPPVWIDEPIESAFIFH